MVEQQTVFVVDDDAGARDSVCALIESMGLAAEPLSSAEDFLTAYDASRSGCLVTDLRMVGMSGLELQQQLLAKGISLPIIVISAYVNVSSAVKAMQGGAVTVIKKPYEDQQLWDAIQTALKRDSARRIARAHRDEILQRFALLSPEELEVLDLVAAGLPNKTAAKRLGLSIRTIEDRRGRVMKKLQARSFAELMELVIARREIEKQELDPSVPQGDA